MVLGFLPLVSILPMSASSRMAVPYMFFGFLEIFIFGLTTTLSGMIDVCMRRKNRVTCVGKGENHVGEKKKSALTNAHKGP